MPLYLCNAVKGVIPEGAKAKIAADITDIHCDITGAPRTFVHVFFFEDAPQIPVHGKSVFLFGSIRNGRSAEQKTKMLSRIRASIVAHAGIPLAEVLADTMDVPASWVMEGGDVLPEPGEEAAWLAEHAAAAP
ncbi:tautomerase family protein [Shimia sp. MMG029]|uniref:tautomerase family protein n=1 Tax=Shimia sp. MMG029 TaxID=3021978 RepID=UPI0022FE2D53|nr:tautomerase family protein [Shimia sp. MMG029]MDA5558492.1 tautomerase family protein [Shimia sp. MMG029]